MIRLVTAREQAERLTFWDRHAMAFTAPPAANSAYTQVPNTGGTYSKAHAYFDKMGAPQGNALDYGAGLGHSSTFGDTFEPYPQKGFEPTYRRAEDVPKGTYHRVTNLNVLNVVPPEIRHQIVAAIGQSLAPGGHAVITTRGLNEVLATKGGVPADNGDPGAIIVGQGTPRERYQKGFTRDELHQYVAGQLGDGYTVSKVPLGPAGVHIVRNAARTAARTAERAGFWRQGMPWYHSTDAELNPGDELQPAAERGHASRWTQADGYDPHSVYFNQWDNDDDADDNFGKNRYEVEPVGPVSRDPEFEYAKQDHMDDGVDWEGGGVYNEEDVPGYNSYIAPRARVVRKLPVAPWQHTSARVSQSAAPDSPELASYLGQAHRNLMATSRTAQGVVDTSASPDKAQHMQVGHGQEAADLATQNFTDAIRQGFAQRDRQFNSPEEVRQFVEGLGAQINKGITHEGTLYRTHDSPKYPYTPAADIPRVADQFYRDLHAGLNNPHVDPTELAAYAEYSVDPGIHLFADGCGKAAKALSSYILMRHRQPLPQHPGRDPYYRAVTRSHPHGTDPHADAAAFDNFLDYYRSVMPGTQRTAIITTPMQTTGRGALNVTPTAPRPDKPVMLVYGGAFNPPHEGHVGALRHAHEALTNAGYHVAGSIVAPTADKLLAAKEMDPSQRLNLQARAQVTQAAFPTDINGAPVTVSTGPSEEVEQAQGKPRRTDLANWVQAHYPDHTVVNVTGEDAVVPGAPPVHPSLYAGAQGSNHAGYAYLTLPRDEVAGISSSKIRAAELSGAPLPGVNPRIEQAYRQALAHHRATSQPVRPVARRVLTARERVEYWWQP